MKSHSQHQTSVLASSQLTFKNEHAMPKRIVRIDRVIELTGLSRAAIYDRLNTHSCRFDSSFPKRLKLGGSSNSAVGWVESEVMAWIDQCCRIG